MTTQRAQGNKAKGGIITNHTVAFFTGHTTIDPGLRAPSEDFKYFPTEYLNYSNHKITKFDHSL